MAMASIMREKAASAYLDKHAEAEAALARQLLASNALHYARCLSIPVYDEPARILPHFLQLLTDNPATLLVLVINQPQSTHHSETNHVLAQAVTASGEPLAGAEGLQLTGCANGSALLRVDRFSQGRRIDDKQGVGLARKIGADIALALWHHQLLDCPWLYCSDADATLPAGYFAATEANDKATTAACLYPFTHRAGSDIRHCRLQQAHELYQRRLQQYVDGLAFANSPYAFHTVGSTMAINLPFYARVRGFPKRSGGEDFYLLNKLRKTGEISSLKQPQIILQSRVSSRAPFGTGVAVEKLLASEDMQSEPIFYPAAVFRMLQQVLLWLQGLHPLDQAGDVDIDWRQHLLATTTSHYSDAKKLVEALDSIDFDSGLAHCIRYGKDKAQFDYHMMCWLDAFRTLKLVHYLRDHYHPALSANELAASDDHLLPAKNTGKKTITGRPPSTVQ